MAATLKTVAVLALVGVAAPAYAHGHGEMSHPITSHPMMQPSNVNHRTPNTNSPQFIKANNLVLGTWISVAKTYLADLQSGNKAGAERALHELRSLSKLANKFDFTAGGIQIGGHTFLLGQNARGQVIIDGKNVRS